MLQNFVVMACSLWYATMSSASRSSRRTKQKNRQKLSQLIFLLLYLCFGKFVSEILNYATQLVNLEDSLIILLILLLVKYLPLRPFKVSLVALPRVSFNNIRSWYPEVLSHPSPKMGRYDEHAPTIAPPKGHRLLPGC